MSQILAPILIVIFTAALAIVTLIREDAKRKKSKAIKTIVILLIFAILVVSGINILQNNYIERQYWYKANIEGHETGTPALKIGSARLVPAEGYDGPFFNITGDTIRVWSYNGELRIQAVVRDAQGNIIADVIGNTFIVNPNVNSDFNYDEKAFEVKDITGDIVLQIQMEKDGVLFAGKFYTNDGWRIGIGNNIIEKRPPGQSLQLTIEPLFKYPGDKYLGVRK